MEKRRGLKTLISILVIIGLALGICAISFSTTVVKRGEVDLACSIGSEGKLQESEIEDLKNFNADCILVLGCGIIDYDTPTSVLADRLDAGIELYNQGVAPKLLLTGDNGTQGHNEIHVMLNYCIGEGVPPEDIFCDHAGFSTAESMIRARNIFGVERAIVVTQTYHEYRALFLGQELGIEVKGVGADQRKYKTGFIGEIREILARDKDYLKMKRGDESAVGGEEISLKGDGRVSHGE